MRLLFLAFLVLFIFVPPVLAGEFNIVAPQEIHTLELDTSVQTTGVVIVEPDVLGPQYFYINGAQIYSYYKDFPELNIGDEITVQGVISQSRGEKRIKIKIKDDITIIARYRDPTPIVTEIAKINGDLIGQLIKINGRVVERTGERIFIDEGGLEEVVAYIKKYTDIDKSRIGEGDRVEVTGVVSRSGDELRILPRSDNDIIFLEFLEAESPKIGQVESGQGKIQEMVASEGSAAQVVDFNAMKPYFIIASIILGALFIILSRVKYKSKKV
ncbi:hypothetical protein MYX06_02540 [Patescibacteria group bacterium AH-259-L05]|nr:hypothetical protein [Patescibacteria group bacterium AH-259-L05]